MRSTVISIIGIILTGVFAAFAQQQKGTSKATGVPTEAFGTFEGTQKSYVMYIGDFGLPVPGLHWKLKIKQNKIELFQQSGTDTYLYTGGYSVNKTGALACRLKALSEGTVVDYTPTLKYLRDEQGQYYWILQSGVESEPEVILKRTEE